MVLKSLPDIKTLVSLWHSLQGKVLSKGRVGANTLDDLLPEDKLRNSGEWRKDSSDGCSCLGCDEFSLICHQ